VDMAEQHAYCGIYCGTCTSSKFNRKLQVLARELKLQVDLTRFEYWISELVEFDFDEFREGLEYMAEHVCPGCREGGGPQCTARPCARERGLTSCLECEDFATCEHTEYVRTTYPFILRDWELAQEEGLQAAFAAIEQRGRRGFENQAHLFERCAKVVDVRYRGD